MPDVEIRKIVVTVEDIFHENGPASEKPHKRAVASAIIRNPFAGAYHPDIAGFMEDLKPLGLRLTDRLIEALGADKSTIDGFGKGAIVGEGGEIEHGALWHVPGGYSMRERLDDAKAIVPSTKKVGGPGTKLDVPITHINASYVRSHFDAVEVGITDAPRVDELVYILAMTCGPRIHARVGGLAAEDITGEDGLR